MKLIPKRKVAPKEFEAGADIVSYITDIANNLTESTQYITQTTNQFISTQMASVAQTSEGASGLCAVNPYSLAHSVYGERIIGCLVEAGSNDLATGDAKNGNFFRIPATCNGWRIIAVSAQVFTAGTTGLTTIQLRNVTKSVDVLSTRITIDSAEKDSLTAATPAVINTANNSVATGKQFTWDVDTVQTTAPKGLYCEVILRLS